MFQCVKWLINKEKLLTNNEKTLLQIYLDFFANYINRLMNTNVI